MHILRGVYCAGYVRKDGRWSDGGYGMDSAASER